jgi:nitrate reductase assembly molybdenum cofactor insertion protein NarJ
MITINVNYMTNQITISKEEVKPPLDVRQIFCLDKADVAKYLNELKRLDLLRIENKYAELFKQVEKL